MALGLILMSLAGQCYGAAEDLQVGFYADKCVRRGFFGLFPRKYNVEDIVAAKVRYAYFQDKTIVAALLRMQFHDCFVHGCDASILLDGPDTEKTTKPNLSVRGYELIDDIKREIERTCPGVVTCADIIAMATRDAVSLAISRSAWEAPYKFDVETGRGDSYEPHASEVIDLPPSTATASDSIQAFQKKGLTVTDMVYLLGGHSVGVTHCRFIQDRLYNFSNTGRPDPTMNPRLARSLGQYCKSNPANPINLDQGTPSIVDNSYYKQVLYWQNGILKVDQDIAFNEASRSIVGEVARDTYQEFNVNFGEAMVNLQRVGVLPYQEGQVRQSCRVPVQI
ncbi:hypothetical protein TIFTF001_016068 [Ficus carica]|uniref:Peroxidase n=1 Tax=Ficus carica TaxID=3494 RepID=A0AA88D9J4_FICCA|nr:hypothetical protein TIFTF001_016068 [Ficus carica]